MKTVVIQYLFDLIDNGCEEDYAIGETAWKFHKLEITGRNLRETHEIIRKEYYGYEHYKI